MDPRWQNGSGWRMAKPYKYISNSNYQTLSKSVCNTYRSMFATIILNFLDHDYLTQQLTLQALRGCLYMCMKIEGNKTDV